MCTTCSLITIKWRWEAASQFSIRPSEALNLTVSTKAEGHRAVWVWRPLVCRHQRVKGEERLNSTALISSNNLLSKSQLLLHHDQKGTDHRGLFELHCSSLQPLHWSLLVERPGLRLEVKAFLIFLFTQFIINSIAFIKLQNVNSTLSACIAGQHTNNLLQRNHLKVINKWPDWLEYSLLFECLVKQHFPLLHKWWWNENVF